jgi:osmotically inducible lipoprotein OsmB
MRTTMIIGFAAALLVAGCGTSTGDRLVSGAAIGAAGGAAIGALAGNPGMGAAAGAIARGAVLPRSLVNIAS